MVSAAYGTRDNTKGALSAFQSSPHTLPKGPPIIIFRENQNGKNYIIMFY